MNGQKRINANTLSNHSTCNFTEIEMKCYYQVSYLKETSTYHNVQVKTDNLFGACYVCMGESSKGVLAIRRIFSLVDMIAKPKF